MLPPGRNRSRNRMVVQGVGGYIREPGLEASPPQQSPTAHARKERFSPKATSPPPYTRGHSPGANIFVAGRGRADPLARGRAGRGGWCGCDLYVAIALLVFVVQTAMLLSAVQSSGDGATVQAVGEVARAAGGLLGGVETGDRDLHELPGAGAGMDAQALGTVGTFGTPGAPGTGGVGGLRGSGSPLAGQPVATAPPTRAPTLRPTDKPTERPTVRPTSRQQQVVADPPPQGSVMAAPGVGAPGAGAPGVGAPGVGAPGVGGLGAVSGVGGASGTGAAPGGIPAVPTRIIGGVSKEDAMAAVTKANAAAGVVAPPAPVLRGANGAMVPQAFLELASMAQQEIPPDFVDAYKVECVAGLANRLRQLLTAHWYATRILEKKIIVKWTPDIACPAFFHNLFESLPGMLVLAKPPGDFPTARRGGFSTIIDGYIRDTPEAQRPLGWSLQPRPAVPGQPVPPPKVIPPADFRMSGLQQEVWGQLRPVAAIVAQADAFIQEHGLDQDGISLHIRRTDHAVQVGKEGTTTDSEFLSWVNRHMAMAAGAGGGFKRLRPLKIFLATDNPDTRRQFRQQYGDRVISYGAMPGEDGEKLAATLTTKTNRLTTVEQALVEAVIASRCTEFKGTAGAAKSTGSSFSMMIFFLFKKAHPQHRTCVPSDLDTSHPWSCR